MEPMDTGADTGMVADWETLRSLVGLTGQPTIAPVAVSADVVSMWCVAMGVTDPAYVDGAAAPPAMLDVWSMVGLDAGIGATATTDDPHHRAYGMLSEAGFTGVVATNSDQSYDRLLQPGDQLTRHTTLASVSDRKRTALGEGHFVTTESEFRDHAGDRVGTLRFTVFKFRPVSGGPGGGDSGAPSPERPRPRWNADQAWHWEGLRDRELRIQRFPSGRLVHPPQVTDPATGEPAGGPETAGHHDWVVASGDATLHSWTVTRHPPHPAFPQPNVVGLVELAEGVRLVTNVVGVPPERLAVGMPLVLDFHETHEDVTLHRFRPVVPPRHDRRRPADEVAVGDRLPLTPIDVTVDQVTGGAVATRDPQDVHHDPAAARDKGLPDVFMNILTSTGLVTRWIGDWAGPGAVLDSVRIGLGSPTHPGDLLTLDGSVTSVADGSTIEVAFTGRTERGTHVHGTATVVLPDSGPTSASGSGG